MAVLLKKAESGDNSEEESENEATSPRKTCAKTRAANYERLIELLSLLSQKEDGLKEIEPELEAEIPMDELEADLARSLEYQNNANLWRTRATRAIERAQQEQQNAATGVQPPRLSDVSTRSTSTRPSVKLPKLSINKYNGEVCMWQEVWDQYENAIHLNPDLSKTEKFIYLKSYLTGSAAWAVAGLKVTEPNYDTAVDMHRRRFGRKDLIVSAQ